MRGKESNLACLEGDPLAIGITGASGSGKTTLANALKEYLHPYAVTLAHDDYYKHLPNMTKQEASAYDFDCPESLDTYILVNHLQELKSNRAVDVPSYNFETHVRTPAARHVEPAPIILVEGLLIMCVPVLRSLFDLIVFIDTDPFVSALRRMRRDCQERGADVSLALKMYFGGSKPAYEKLVEPLKGEAGLIIPDSDDESMQTVVRAIVNLRKNSPKDAS